MERWDEAAALARMRRAFEYVELRRDQESSDNPPPGEQETLKEMRLAFEAQDMRALRNATRRYIREAPHAEFGKGDPEKDEPEKDEP